MFVVRRLAAAIPALFVVSVLAFWFVDMIPGDPAAILAGTTASDEEIATVREFLGLNQPLGARYIRFLKGLVDPELATSFRFGGIPYPEAEASLRLFATEVLPVLKKWN